jgi:hypothetical protein
MSCAGLRAHSARSAKPPRNGPEPPDRELLNMTARERQIVRELHHRKLEASVRTALHNIDYPTACGFPAAARARPRLATWHD